MRYGSRSLSAARNEPTLSPFTMAVLLGLLIALLPGPLRAQKTDVITLNNGDDVTGEMKSLERMVLVFKTDAMGTTQVEWQKVVTVNTDKRFAIALADGTIYFGYLKPGPADSVVIVTDSDSVPTPTQEVVALERLKPNFWAALDGKIRAGIAFTQQNARTDFTLGWDLKYVRRSYLTRIDLNYRFSRQDETDDIYNLTANLAHGRQFKGRWFYIGFLDAATNSQLSLDLRGSGGGGLGRFLIQSNRMDLGVWVAPAYSYEKYTGESGKGTFPIVLAADYQLVFFGAHDTDLNSQLAVIPILSDSGRWRLSFTLSFERETLKNLDLGIGITESYDSRPPAVDANKNDFSFNTYLAWSY